MIEVITDITTEAGGGLVSVHYFDEQTAVPTVAVAAVSGLWNDIKSLCTVTTTYQVRGSGRLVDEATGALTGFYTGASSSIIIGGVSNSGVPDAAQALIQWRTGVVRNGREVRGRTFVPGIAALSLAGGNLFDPARAQIAGAASEMTDPSFGFGIWSRPKDGQPGAHIQTSGADCWQEFAVLRRRRA